MAIQGTFDDEAVKAFNRCTSQGIKIYPVPTTNGTAKTKAKVKIIVDYGLRQVESKEIYIQDDKLTDKVLELYKIIAKRI